VGVSGALATPCHATPQRFASGHRRALLLGTALASTLLLGSLAAPAPASAAVPCPQPPGGPINVSSNSDSIECTNVFDIYGAPGVAISLTTSGDAYHVTLDNSGNLGAGLIGIYTLTSGNGSYIDIVNTGNITVSSFAYHVGILARTIGPNSAITVNNSGNLTVTTSVDAAYGILARTSGTQSSVGIVNTGDLSITTTSSYGAYGIFARVDDPSSSIDIRNSGELTVNSADWRAFGILSAIAIGPVASGVNNTVTNSGKITSSGFSAYGIGAYSSSFPGGSVAIVNSGPITALGDLRAAGILGVVADGRLSITNSGPITVTGDSAMGIIADVYDDSTLRIANSGAISAVGSYFARGILATSDEISTLSIENHAKIVAFATYDAIGIAARTGYGSPLTIANHGDVTAKAQMLSYCSCYDYAAYGIRGAADQPGSPISISNTATVKALGPSSVGVAAISRYYANQVVVKNAGSIYGGSVGLLTDTTGQTTIVNSGDIGAGSNLAILGKSGPVDIFNTGTITGFVLLDADDKFINQAGGTFEARQTSDFDATGTGGTDLFRNEAGAVVHTAGDITRSETTRFVNLERFENRGLISLVDNKPGDSFTISNTPGGTDLKFAAGPGSTLAVDAFLGGPGSRSDTFTVEGDVSGVTTVQVNNTSFGPGVFNSQGIPVVFVSGETPNPNAFQLDQSIDTGFFNYDLFFTPTGSGFWELRSFAGPGAFLLPQLVTAAQDIWHQSASTWFDRTADLRVLMAGGSAPTAYDPGGKSLDAAGPYPLTPAVWARGSGGWLDRDGTQRTTAYGRDYSFDMDRDLETIDFQVGVDMGKRDVLTGGDALVFGLLGGFVHGDLDYDALARAFNFDGGQVGAYATYLNGGLFVDTLLNVHLYSLDTNTLGFPDSLDANAVGLRTDTGYRFGSFSGGPFIEPLATIEVMWADIDGFSLGGNTVSFGDDANVRGRLGLRAGTTTEAWDGTLMEPFVIGSLWGNLTDDNSATLVSTGRTFRFEDQLQDVWGEVSAGVNFFNFSQTTAVFAKVDVTFGDDLTGVGGKAGMRVNW
jgi:Autotransporter beta-domain/Autochaperone Domain Type 1